MILSASLSPGPRFSLIRRVSTAPDGNERTVKSLAPRASRRLRRPRRPFIYRFLKLEARKRRRGSLDSVYAGIKTRRVKCRRGRRSCNSCCKSRLLGLRNVPSYGVVSRRSFAAGIARMARAENPGRSIGSRALCARVLTSRLHFAGNSHPALSLVRAKIFGLKSLKSALLCETSGHRDLRGEFCKPLALDEGHFRPAAFVPESVAPVSCFKSELRRAREQHHGTRAGP